MGSRGSVIPLFVSQLSSNKPITITDPNMTRFTMTLDEAVKLFLYSFKMERMEKFYPEIPSTKNSDISKVFN